MRAGGWLRRLGGSRRWGGARLSGCVSFVRENRFVFAFTGAAAALAFAFGNSSDVAEQRRLHDGSVRNVRHVPGPIVECAADKRLTIQELTELLGLRLGPIRNKLWAQGYPAPTVGVAQYGTTEQTHALEILLPRSVNVATVLAGALRFTNEGVNLRSNGDSIGIISSDGACSVLLEPANDEIKIGLYKTSGFTRAELETYAQWYHTLCFSIRKVSSPRKPQGPESTTTDAVTSPSGTGQNDSIIQELGALGVGVYQKSKEGGLDWECIAGYDSIKRAIQDSILMPLQHPETYDKIATGTRVRFETNRPRAILFEGPPGTGKTLSARIIAEQCGVPLIHVPLESIVTKWFGESERNLAQVFEKAEELGGAIIFIDEIDALGVSRDSGEMHEASRRVLSVLLQRLDGFKGRGKSTLICATNRKQDLDAALANRFGMTLFFGLPDLQTREKVLQRYAKHLKSSELAEIANKSRGMSCRDLKEICEHTERKWAARLVRQERVGPLPTVEEYMHSVHDRLESFDRHKSAVRM